MALESYLLERREVNFMGCSGFGGINRYLCITWWHALLLIYFFDIFTNRFTFTQWNGYLNYFSISYNFCKLRTSPLEHVCCYLRIVDWHLLLWESDKKNKWSHWKSRQLLTTGRKNVHLPTNPSSPRVPWQLLKSVNSDSSSPLRGTHTPWHTSHTWTYMYESEHQWAAKLLHRPSTSFSSFLSFLSGDKNSMSSNSIPLLLMYSTLKGRGSRRGQKLQSSWQENHWSTELVTLSTYHVVGLCQTILCK